MNDVTESPDPSVAEHVRRYLATDGVVRARTAEGAERARLWGLVVRLAPVYRAYEARSPG